MDNPPFEIAAGMQDGAVRILRKHLPQVIDDEFFVELLKNSWKFQEGITE